MSASNCPDLPIPKVPKGRQPLKVERAERSAFRRGRERRQKDGAKLRDQRKCRVPHCASPRFSIQSAHLNDKGMGGDPQGIRTTLDLLLTTCFYHHLATDRPSLHDKTLKVEYLTSDRASGPLAFYVRADVQSPWRLLGRERAIHVLEPLDPTIAARLSEPGDMSDY